MQASGSPRENAATIFNSNMTELDLQVQGTERVSHLMCYLDTVINGTGNSVDIELAKSCKLYLESRNVILLRNLLEVSYIINGGIMLKHQNNTANTATQETTVQEKTTPKTSSIETQTDKTVYGTMYHETDEESDLEFLRLVNAIDEIDVKP
jgi:hypothetical protein